MKTCTAPFPGIDICYLSPERRVNGANDCPFVITPTSHTMLPILLTYQEMMDFISELRELQMLAEADMIWTMGEQDARSN